MLKFQNKTSLITGSGTGIGQAIAKKFVENGASVIILGRRREPLDETSKMIESIKYVDQIIKAPPCPITKQFILEHNIDIVVHANDMSQETLNNWYKVPIEMGKFQTVDYTKGITTSEIINRIKTRIENKTL